MVVEGGILRVGRAEPEVEGPLLPDRTADLVEGEDLEERTQETPRATSPMEGPCVI